MAPPFVLLVSFVATPFVLLVSFVATPFVIFVAGQITAVTSTAESAVLL